MKATKTSGMLSKQLHTDGNNAMKIEREMNKTNEIRTRNRTRTKVQRDEASNQYLLSLLHVHICSTAGGRSAPRLARKSTNE